MEPSTKTILIIDDDPTSRQLFGGLLVTAGYKVDFANNGEEGRVYARRIHPDLILLDINMPGDDGYQTAGRIKNDPGSPGYDIPIVFLSIDKLPATPQKWMTDLGVSGYIHKGISNTDFVERIKQIFIELENKAGSKPAADQASTDL